MPSQPRPAFRLQRLARPAGLMFAVAALGLAGCSQQRQAGYYAPPAESTITDAQDQAQDARNRSLVRAPSQLQIDLRRDAPAARNGVSALQTPPEAQATASSQPVPVEAGAAPAPLSRVIPQPQTYLGTLPCFHPGMQCTAQRITVTLAPNHRWRARAAYLDESHQDGSALVDQGCWRELAERPPRILLVERNGNVRADLLLAANTLRVLAVNGQAPNLAYSLTRQPDLDAIDELSGEPAPNCD